MYAHQLFCISSSFWFYEISTARVYWLDFFLSSQTSDRIQNVPWKNSVSASSTPARFSLHCLYAGYPCRRKFLSSLYPTALSRGDVRSIFSNTSSFASPVDNPVWWGRMELEMWILGLMEQKFDERGLVSELNFGKGMQRDRRLHTRTVRGWWIETHSVFYLFMYTFILERQCYYFRIYFCK